MVNWLAFWVVTWLAFWVAFWVIPVSSDTALPTPTIVAVSTAKEAWEKAMQVNARATVNNKRAILFMISSGLGCFSGFLPTGEKTCHNGAHYTRMTCISKKNLGKNRFCVSKRLPAHADRLCLASRLV